MKVQINCLGALRGEIGLVDLCVGGGFRCSDWVALRFGREGAWGVHRWDWHNRFGVQRQSIMPICFQRSRRGKPTIEIHSPVDLPLVCAETVRVYDLLALPPIAGETNPRNRRQQQSDCRGFRGR